MGEIILSTKELLVIASYLGGDDFFGVQDPFRGMTEEEIKAEIPSIRLAAEKRGLATLGFDDTFVLNETTRELISTGVFCEKYLMVDCIDNGVQAPREIVYSRGGTLVLLKQQNEECLLKTCSAEEIVANLISVASGSCARERGQKEPLTMGQAHLIRAAESENPERFLLDAGCCPEVAEILALGLQRKCKYAAFVLVDIKARKARGFSVIVSAKGLLQLESDSNGEGEWILRWISKNELEKQLFCLLSNDGAAAGEEKNAIM